MLVAQATERVPLGLGGELVLADECLQLGDPQLERLPLLVVEQLQPVLGVLALSRLDQLRVEVHYLNIIVE